ncbi:hypothetical protein HGM15179_019087 [Zosterops borbonicus]|uniref:Core shell protein Gag P30 domain-containing protein n=1 Tax=Zosterops borbonicus TaxID=364589 RepID=A0A8K1FYA7_9PASS|nr:hypothetical protein HGM15179_019087 [Zosterops borbonicus]
MIMKTQNPDWEDIQVILDTLMDDTERDMVFQAEKDRAREDIRNGLVTGTLDYNFPTEDPEWNPNDPSGIDMLRLKRPLLGKLVRPEVNASGIQRTPSRLDSCGKAGEQRDREDPITPTLTGQAHPPDPPVFLGYEMGQKLSKLDRAVYMCS